MTESPLPKFTIRELLEAGVHFGHKTMRWNPKMRKYLYGSRDNLHIIDLQQTAVLMQDALQAAKDIAKNNGRILFVATKKQASGIIAEAATKCGQYYVNDRWLGGMLTNWNTISRSIKTLKQIEEQLVDEESDLYKKEKLVLDRKREKLENILGGIRNMDGHPDLIIVIDTKRETTAIKEAKILGIPIMAILDSNSNPEGINYPIPGNDDSIKAIKLYCSLLSDAILSGIKESMSAAGISLEEINGESIEDIKQKTQKKVEQNRAESKIKKLPAKKEEAALAKIKESKVPAKVEDDLLPAEVEEEKLPVKVKKAPTPAKTTAKKTIVAQKTGAKSTKDKK